MLEWLLQNARESHVIKYGESDRVFRLVGFHPPYTYAHTAIICAVRLRPGGTIASLMSKRTGGALAHAMRRHAPIVHFFFFFQSTSRHMLEISLPLKSGSCPCVASHRIAQTFLVRSVATSRSAVLGVEA